MLNKNIIFTIAIGFLLFGTCNAVLKTWVGALGALFGLPLNWLPVGLPGILDDVVISGVQSAISNSTSSINSLALGLENALDKTNLTVSGVFYVTQAVTVNRSGNLIAVDSGLITFATLNIHGGNVSVLGHYTFKGPVVMSNLASLDVVNKILTLDTLSSTSSIVNINNGSTLFTDQWQMTNSLLFNERSTIVLTTPKTSGVLTTLSSHSVMYFEFSYFSAFYHDVLLQNTSAISCFSSSLHLSNMTINLYNTTYMDMTISQLTMEKTNYYLRDNTNFSLYDSMALFNASNMYLHENSKVYCVNSNITLLNAPDGFYSYDNSQIFVTGAEGMVFTHGKHYMLNSSSYLMNETSKLVVIGELIMQDSSYLESNKSNIIINGKVSMSNNGRVKLGVSSILYVNGTLQLNDKSNIVATGSYIVCNGKANMLINGGLSATLSAIVVNGSMTSNGENKIYGSTVLVFGEFLSSGDNTYTLTNITTGGNAVFDQSFTGSYSFITVNQGDLIIKKGSQFKCTQCRIVIENGNFVYDANSTINLYNTSLTNVNGEVASIGSIILYKGSTISNSGTFNLSSDILKSNDVTEQIIFYNSGQFSTDSISKLEIPISNNGAVNIQNNSDIYFTEYNQYSGSLSVSHGAKLSSNKTFVIKNGVVQGNGTINGNVQSSGNLGSQQFNIDKMNLNGTLTQNGNITINIVTLDDFSQFNISDLAKFGGVLNININSDLHTNDQKNLTVMNYMKSEGLFDSINIRTFNPSTGEKSTTGKCSYNVNQSEKSLSVLVSSCDTGNKKLSTGAIAGIVVGIVVAAVIIGTVIHYRNRIRLKINSSQKLVKLKSMVSQK
ncbi:hypothetical protein PPL_05935 [Heterostelium album PN500]|uniref:Uncharacterized protein n=1 Tax=Heterostelium pallidum (strain ATCC 26659 / Pp 5 / PN500) TaxID=670386 RepID=D3BBR6_HETP5|nr:hypothetical protein PPL_05935 [Heterostelium album PN500]EFA81099.1 hypothetical protein PPL_05935 [Heterostelium album PN500]|eukprot:XP_020433217.1 hypothetical protein PPL_05935 [Heterostelium album PN500]